MLLAVFRGREAGFLMEGARERAVGGESASFRHFAYWQVGAGEPFACQFQPVLLKEKVYSLAGLVPEHGINDFPFDFYLFGYFLRCHAAIARQNSGHIVQEGRVRLGWGFVDRLHAHPSFRVRYHFRFQRRYINIVHRDVFMFHIIVFLMLLHKNSFFSFLDQLFFIKKHYRRRKTTFFFDTFVEKKKNAPASWIHS